LAASPAAISAGPIAVKRALAMSSGRRSGQRSPAFFAPAFVAVE
jgi:hypothetical protein